MLAEWPQLGRPHQPLVKHAFTRLEFHQTFRAVEGSNPVVSNFANSSWPMALHASSNLSDAKSGERIWTCHKQDKLVCEFTLRTWVAVATLL